MNTDILYHELKVQTEKIKPTTTDAYQFEKNCRANFISEFLTNKVQHIEKHQSFIGKEVFKFKKSFNYTDNTSLDDIFNPVFEEKVLFTQELYNSFLQDYFDFSKEYCTKRLIEKQITRNSTNKLSNLQFEWELECTQELIKLFNKVLNK